MLYLTQRYADWMGGSAFMVESGGLSAVNRRYVERLHRELGGPFTVDDATAVLEIDRARAARLVRYLADRGWLDRVRRGLYLPVPLDAHRSGEAHQDPWVVATVLFDAAHIGGWSAAEHWDLTEQIFRDVLVVSTRRPRDRRPAIGGTQFVIRTIDPNRRFGLTPVWRGEHRVDVSDPSRTVVDLLADPSWGGGMRQAADMVCEYFDADFRDDELLIAYGDRLNVGSVFKRLGYMIDLFELSAGQLRDACLLRRTTGINDLDPAAKSEGPISTRWGIRANVHLASPVA